MNIVAREELKMNNLVLKARLVFKSLTWLFAVCIALQVFLAGLALFWDPAKWASHTGFAKILMVLPILMLITAFIARLPRSLLLRSAGLIGMFILMFITAKFSSKIGLISALHPVIAMMMFWSAMNIRRMSHDS